MKKKKKRKKKEDGGRSGQDALYNWLTPDHPPLAASTDILYSMTNSSQKINIDVKYYMSNFNMF